MPEVIGALIGSTIGGVIVWLMGWWWSNIQIAKEFPPREPKDYFWWRDDSGS